MRKKVPKNGAKFNSVFFYKGCSRENFQLMTVYKFLKYKTTFDKIKYCVKPFY